MKPLSAVILLALVLTLCAGCGTKKPASEPDVSLFDVVCSADEALEQARAAGLPVMENLRCTSGQDTWDNFYKTVSAGKPSQVLCLHYYTLDPDTMTAEAYEREKDDYPLAALLLVSFDGEKYTVSERVSRDAEPEYTSTYPYLLHLTGDAPTSFARYSTYDNYVLSDNPDITMEDIWRAMVSNDASVAFAFRHYTVFNNFMD